MTGVRSTLACAGCGRSLAPDESPFRCPGARDGVDVDHVLRRTLEVSDDARRDLRAAFRDDEPNPFLRYGPLLHTTAAVDGRFGSGTHAALVARLDEAIGRVDGSGFRVTPAASHDALARAVGLDVPVWIKDETDNVSGTHKARHLMGILIYLEAWADAAADPTVERARHLAIASCGNAALAAAVLARAAGRPLDVFVPEDAESEVVDLLRTHRAMIHVCERDPSVPGDPTVRAFREAVTGGAVPFACQGNENGLTIDGGKTLAWELVSQLASGGETLDHLFVQVGGGALASACVQALTEAVALGVLERAPRVHTVQTTGAAPLRRAYLRLVEALAGQTPFRAPDETDELERWDACARTIATRVPRETLDARIAHAATHRSAFMSPWETPPRSLAHAILDDETYDWLAVVDGMLRTGGVPIVVDDATLRRAHELAHAHTHVPVSVSGAAGLAGLIAYAAAGGIAPGERAAVLFTGRER